MTPEQIAALDAPAGRRLLARLAEDRSLATLTALRRDHPGDLVALAATQAALREAARAKFGADADALLYTREGLEMATGGAAARWRADRLCAAPSLGGGPPAPTGPGPVGDLCCGIGGDLLALARRTAVLAVDRDPGHLALAARNAAELGLGDRVRALLADVTTLDLRGLGLAAAVVDPARRSGGARRWDGEPGLDWVARAGAVLPLACTTAPGLPLERVPAGWEVEFVGSGRELKEAVLWSPPFAAASTRASLPGLGMSLLDDGGGPGPVAAPGPWLHDPVPGVGRAGLVATLARLIGGWQIDPQIAFLCTATPVTSPWTRLLQVEASLAFDARAVTRVLRGLGVGPVDVRRRGLAGDVEQLARRWRGTGRRAAVVAITRAEGRPWALVCTAPVPASGPAPEPAPDRGV